MIRMEATCVGCEVALAPLPHQICAIGHTSAGVDLEARARLERDARRYLLPALAAERSSIEPPRLIAIGGLIASGKSTLAEALGRRLSIPVLNSDRTRKALLIIDASFRTRSMRQQVRQLSRALGVAFTFVECRVPIEVSRQRLRERAKAPSISDGRSEILDEFSSRYEPVVELAVGEHVIISSAGPVS